MHRSIRLLALSFFAAGSLALGCSVSSDGLVEQKEGPGRGRGGAGGAGGDNGARGGSTGDGGSIGSGGNTNAGGSSRSGGLPNGGSIQGGQGGQGGTGGQGTGGQTGGSAGNTMGGQGGVPACQPGGKRCEGTSPETCQDGRWVRGNACMFACDQGDCTGVCVPTDGSCVGLTPRTCDARGQWSAGGNCPFACSKGMCTGECTTGDHQCSDKIPRTCVANTWQNGTACPLACSAGMCVDGCTPNSTQCSSNNTPQLCDANRNWQSQMMCPFVCTNGACSGECVPNDQDCSGLVPRTCSAAGMWVSGTACPYQCTKGACTGMCTPGTRRCLGGNTVEQCDNAYTWQPAKPRVQQVVLNPSFESGAISWNQMSNNPNGDPLIGDWDYAHTGQQSAFLGFYHSVTDNLWQTFVVPATAISMDVSFYYDIFNEQPVQRNDSDRLRAFIGSQQIAQFTNASETVWAQFTTTIAAPAAGASEIRFTAQTSAAGNTPNTGRIDILLDDINVTLTLCE